MGIELGKKMFSDKGIIGAIATVAIGMLTIQWANHKWMLTHINSRFDHYSMGTITNLNQTDDRLLSSLTAFNARIVGLEKRVNTNSGQISILMRVLPPKVEIMCHPQEELNPYFSFRRL